MKTKEFSFNLPEELIAQAPALRRGTSRLMVLDPRQKTWEHHLFPELPDLIPHNALMVFNDSKVRKARVYSKTKNGGQVEVVFLNPLPQGRWQCLVNKSKRLKIGQQLDLPEGITGTIETETGNVRTLSFTPELQEAYLEKNGHLPLPPYIKRPDNAQDEQRYQTVYAHEIGSAAAPTAGLHFTEKVLQALDEKGIQRCFITLHVGLGTFLPVHEENIEDHKMHLENYTISEETASLLNQAKIEGRPILAVGTTSVRTLESAFDGKSFPAGQGSTSIYITPGYEYKAIDSLFTNFHTPESTLLMLVSAFAGKDFILSAYEEAVKEQYHFFSYGDAMWIKTKA